MVVRIDAALAQKLKIRAARERKSLKALLGAAAKLYLETPVTAAR